MMISVVVSTRNRPDKIGPCLTSILASNYENFEIIVVDQSSNIKTKNILKKISDGRIRYYRTESQGLSKARNFGVKRARGEIITFTDDDCLVNKEWLRGIETFFLKKKRVVGVFGKTLPYKPNKNKGKIAPATFRMDKKRIVSYPYIVHYRTLGLGNNMSIRKFIFREVGYFKEWLGAGSISITGGEESEFIYRVLKQGYRLAYTPNLVVYHNRWLTPRDEELLQAQYSCGLFAFYVYSLLKKDPEITKFIKHRIEERPIAKLKTLFRFFRKPKPSNATYVISQLKYLVWELFFIFKGIVVGSQAYFKKQ